MSYNRKTSTADYKSPSLNTSPSTPITGKPHLEPLDKALGKVTLKSV